MNVIFLDFDGVLDTVHFKSKENVERKIQILSKIVKKYDCKVVISAAAKNALNEKTLKIENKKNEWVKYVMSLFKKYNIEVIGRTPSLKRHYSKYSYVSMWKDDEIRLYLFRHPEIDHYCIIDDNDFRDLVQLKDHLVETKDYCEDNYKLEGLLESHEEEIAKVLSKENDIQRFAIKHSLKK